MQSRAARHTARRLFVQDQPVEAQLPDGFDKLLEVHRLADIAVGAARSRERYPAAPLEEVRMITGSNLGSRVRAQLGQHLETVQPGQFQIEQHNLRLGGIAACVLPVPKRYRPPRRRRARRPPCW